MATGEQEKKAPEKKEHGNTPWSKIPETLKKERAEIAKNLEHETKKLDKEFSEKFDKKPGKNLSKEEVVTVFQESETYKNKSYEDILDILKNGVKKENGEYDTSLQNNNLHDRLQKNVDKESESKKEEEEPKGEKKELNEKDGEAYLISVYGEKPNEANVLRILKEKRSEYKDAKTYDEAMAILKKRRPETWKRLTDRIPPRDPLQTADDKTIDKELAERWFTPDGKIIEDEAKKEDKEEEKTEKKEKKQKKEKKPRKRDLNPLNWIRYGATRFVTGFIGTASLIWTKSRDVFARPQQVFTKQFWKDIGHNIAHIPEAIVKTIWGTVNKNLRSTKKHTYFRNTVQDYGKTRWPESKNRFKKTFWFLGKFIGINPANGSIIPVPKFGIHIANGITLAIEETLQGVKNSKWHWNPKNRNFKSFDYAKTKEIFNKAFKWNHKNKLGAEKEGKVIKMDTEAKEEKKAA